MNEKVKDGSARWRVSRMKDIHIEWSRKLFDSLNDGGVWGLPATGLLFQRQGDALVLIDQMPYEPDMPVTPEQLLNRQAEMYEDCVVHFAAAGVPVLRGTRIAVPST